MKDSQTMSMPAPTTARETSGALRALDWVALLLVVIGALNWALVGLMSVDLVAAIFGQQTMPARIVYVLVGIAGLVTLLRFPKRI